MKRSIFLFTRGWTDLAYASAAIVTVSAITIIVLSVIYLHWTDVINEKFLTSVLAGIIGVTLGAFAAIALSILLVDRYQRRRRAEHF